MKTLIRHFRNPVTRGGTTVALIVDEKTQQVMGRGLAICSDKDQFSRKIGRTLASMRAMKAYTTEENCFEDKIRRPHLKNHLLYPNKCMFKPALTASEHSWVKKSFKGKNQNGRK